MHLPINISDLLRNTIVESDRIEFKAGWNPEAVLRSICAFANDFNNFGGGYIIIGIEEKDGQPLLPPKGITSTEIDHIQKELVRVCSFLKPIYTPIISVEELQGKEIFVIWIPGGHDRPYSAPTTLGKNKEYRYYIRKASSTVIAKDGELKELLSLTATIPFDDRVNHRSSLENIKLPLIQSFLHEVKSNLLEESRHMPLAALCRQMAIVDGGNEYLKPCNVGLLFFNDQPEKFFPYAQIDVVYFPDDEGGDIIQEEIFKGPLDHQLRSAIRHIKNSFITERIVKLPDQAEAVRIFNYPMQAIEEALVNAVYHRSYEIREPIEVRINRESISIVSHPGPEPSITTEDIKRGRLVGRRYRNRRIGEFLKELKFTEGRGTGVPKMRKALLANGSPEPVFFTDDGRLSFWTQINIHPAFLKDHIPTEVYDQVYDEVYDEVHDRSAINLSIAEQRILRLVNTRNVNRNEIIAEFGYKALTGNIKTAIDNLLKLKLIAYTIPNKVRSKRQQYKITPEGIAYLK